MLPSLKILNKFRTKKIKLETGENNLEENEKYLLHLL